MVDKVIDKECDEFINKFEKSLKNDLLKLDHVNTITDLSDCVNIIRSATLLSNSIPIIGFFGAIFSESMCSQNAQNVLSINYKLKNINEYKKIRDHFELGNSLPTDHYINKKDNRELYYGYKNFCKKSYIGTISGMCDMYEFKDFIEKN